MMRLPNIVKREEGFTLVELVVTMAILAILVTVAIGVISFGTRMMAQQRTQSNADMLADTVRTNVIDVIDQASASDKITIAADGASITVYVSNTSAYRASGTYRIYNKTGDGAGQVWIERVGDASQGPYDIVPDSTYIDDFNVTCSFAQKEGSDHIIEMTTTVTDANGNEYTHVVTDVNPVNKPTIEIGS